MCLIKDREFHPHNRPLIAKEDIECYKKLYQVEDTYFTPQTCIQVPIECIQNKVPFKTQILSKCKFIWKHILGFSNSVEDGFIHSCADFPDPSFFYYTFQCIIPKGTKYFIGNEHDYASQQIIFIKRVR